MKNDINLLSGREVKSYSSKKVASTILVVLIIVVLLYAGIAIPSSQLAALKGRAADIDSQLGSASSVQSELTVKTQKGKVLQVKLEEIKALGDSKSDVKEYIDAVENALPKDANITLFEISGTNLSINGTAANDTVIATCCLKLKELKMFSDVLVTGSTVNSDNGLMDFNLVATLPSTLDSTVLIGAIEEKANPSASPTPAPEVSN